MVFKTLHWYILRELLRIFILTASALDVLVALCGIFKPLTKQGLDISQLLTYMINLMPAMLAYTIPIAALFAAVFVHWRLSTDNELTACRASGISFVAIVMPAFALGLIVALVTLGFVNYVVPIFAHRVERVAVSDLSGLLVSQITRQEKFQFKNYVVYADNAVRLPPSDPEVVQVTSTDPNASVVRLDGMAFTMLHNGKSTQVVLAGQATVVVTHSGPDNADTDLSFTLTDAAAYDPNSFRKLSGYLSSIEPLQVPSMLKSKPKFFNITTLNAFRKDPTTFQPVQEIIAKIEESARLEKIGTRLFAQWQKDRAQNKPLTVAIAGDMPESVDRLEISAPQGSIDDECQIHFHGTAGKPIRAEQFHDGKLVYGYSAHDAVVTISPNSFAPDSASVGLEFSTAVAKRDVERGYTTAPPTAALSGLILPAQMTGVPAMAPLDLLKEAASSNSPSMRDQYAKAYDQIQKLNNTITSELNSRGSFSVSCFTLVLLGAALGILLRGKNPLAVFVMGFVPAAFLVLLITTGRQLAESGSNKNVPLGVALIWAGNVIVLGMILAVYARLLRH